MRRCQATAKPPYVSSAYDSLRSKSSRLKGQSTPAEGKRSAFVFISARIPEADPDPIGIPAREFILVQAREAHPEGAFALLVCASTMDAAK